MQTKQRETEQCGYMILTPTPLHNGGMWCAEEYPCKTHGAWKEKTVSGVTTSASTQIPVQPIETISIYEHKLKMAQSNEWWNKKLREAKSHWKAECRKEVEEKRSRNPFYNQALDDVLQLPSLNEGEK